MKDTSKIELFEQMAIPKAVMKLTVPTILSSLVMVIYNLADTYFVGMLNDSIQNSAVTLAAPVLLAFNAVNNMFGVLAVGIPAAIQNILNVTGMTVLNNFTSSYGADAVAAMGIPFLCIDFLAVGVFQACGLGKNAFVFAILRKIILEIPALALLNMLFPLYGLAYAQLTAEIILAAAACAVLIRLFQKLENKKTT